MIVRESPSPRKPPPDPGLDWPPKSARDALLSSPSGAKRLQQATARNETSPSPSKRRRLGDPTPNERSYDDSDVDEETLRLELQAIEARLKLKKLQKTKSETQFGVTPTGSSDDRSQGPISQDQLLRVQVPSSPKPHKPLQQLHNPSAQVQLGIDKGRSAKEMSLKRPKNSSSADTQATAKPTKSFSQRLAESRSNDIARQEKHERLEQRQKHSFGISNPARIVNQAKADSTFLKHNSSCIANKGNRFSEVSNLTSELPLVADVDIEESETFDSYSGHAFSQRFLNHDTLKTALDGKELMPIPKLLKIVISPNYDPPDVDNDYIVFGIIAQKSQPHDKAVTHLNKSNADPNDPEAPQRSKFMVLKLTDLKWELDCFLFDSAFRQFKSLAVGTVVALLNPDIMPPKPALKHTGKFSLKVSSNEGTLLEIGISKDLAFCKGKRKDGQLCSQWVDGRSTEFCEYHVNERSIKARVGRMEINSMASLSSLKERQMKKEKSQKRERDFERWKKKKKRNGEWEDRPGKHRRPGVNSGTYVDSFAQEVGYVIPKEYTNQAHTARLLDAEDYVHGGLSKEERSRRRLAETQKENELAKALGDNGSGMGKEYMKSKRPEGATDNAADSSDKPTKGLDAASLGLVRHDAGDVKLSPAGKRRKTGANRAEPMGWSGAFKRGLLSPSKNENATAPKLNGGEAPAKPDSAQVMSERSLSPNKRARFFLQEKGIRVPGRDSEGGPATNEGIDDEDDLDIIY